MKNNLKQTLILSLLLLGVSCSNNSYASMVIKTIECYRSSRNEAYQEQVISIFEQFGSSCDKKQKYLPAVLAFSQRILKKNEQGNYDRSISPSPEYPLMQYTGELRRNSSGGFSFKTKIQNQKIEISLEELNSQTTDSVGTATGYADCVIANFENICIK